MKRKNTNPADAQAHRRPDRRESSQDAPRVPPVDLSLRINDVAAAAKTPTRKRRKAFVL